MPPKNLPQPLLEQRRGVRSGTSFPETQATATDRPCINSYTVRETTAISRGRTCNGGTTLRRIVIAGCLVMCVVICYVWWADYDRLKNYARDLEWVRCHAVVYRGHLMLWILNQPMIEVMDAWRFADGWRAPKPFTFTMFYFPPVPKAWGWFSFIPCWAAVGIFGTYPLWTMLRLGARRAYRSRKGHCMSCGYDLTGNLSGVCPECGGAVATCKSAS